ncbi:MAG: nucleotidyltransferase domain-containing protein [Solirubrobacterales bacterium]|nr:nucleotidyltransferase domain-containing protein [Solirubrobacterales bacterium]
MRSPATPPAVDKLADRLATTPGVIAVALGGSRATETARHDSDWDLAVYYRTSRRRLDPDDVRALGYTGEVSELGAWGPIVNGGAWLTVADHPVDLLFRDLDLAEHWLREAHAGRFEVLDQHGYLVGAPSYILAGELAVGRPLEGQLPHAEFSDELATSASRYWDGRARVSLMFATIYADIGERVACQGMLASAILCAAHSRLTGRREWALNEKRLVQRAGLRHTDALILGDNQALIDLTATVTQVSVAIGIDPLRAR